MNQFYIIYTLWNSRIQFYKTDTLMVDVKPGESYAIHLSYDSPHFQFKNLVDSVDEYFIDFIVVKKKETNSFFKDNIWASAQFQYSINNNSS